MVSNYSMLHLRVTRSNFTLRFSRSFLCWPSSNAEVLREVEKACLNQLNISEFVFESQNAIVKPFYTRRFLVTFQRCILINKCIITLFKVRKNPLEWEVLDHLIIGILTERCRKHIYRSR